MFEELRADFRIYTDHSQTPGSWEALLTTTGLFWYCPFSCSARLRAMLTLCAAIYLSRKRKSSS